MKKDNYTKVLRLHRDGFEHAEIAEELGISIPSVYRHIQKAQSTLAIMGGDTGFPNDEIHEDDYEEELDVQEEEPVNLSSEELEVRKRELALQERKENRLRNQRDHKAAGSIKTLLEGLAGDELDRDTAIKKLGEAKKETLVACDYDHEKFNGSDAGKLLDALGEVISEFEDDRRQIALGVIQQELGDGKTLNGIGFDETDFLDQVSCKHLTNLSKFFEHSDGSKYSRDEFLRMIQQVECVEEQSLPDVFDSEIQDEAVRVLNDLKAELKHHVDTIDENWFSTSTVMDLSEELLEALCRDWNEFEELESEEL